MPRELKIQDAKASEGTTVTRKADPTVPGEVGATLSGNILRVLVKKGSVVKKGDPLMVTEAMKMETTLTAPVDGMVKDILVQGGARIQSGDLLAVIE